MDFASFVEKGSSTLMGAGMSKVSFSQVLVQRTAKRNRRNVMSIIRLAVETHARKSGQTIREILAAAYFKKYGKQMPEQALMEDVRRWEHGECNINYLYDFIMDTQCS